MSDKYVPIKPKSSQKDSLKSVKTLKKVGIGKDYVSIKPIDTSAKSKSTVTLKATGGTEYVPLKRVPSEGSGLVPLKAGKSNLGSSFDYNYKVISNAGTLVFLDKRNGNIASIMFSDSKRVVSEYTSKQNPRVTDSPRRIHDNVSCVVDGISYPAPFAFTFLLRLHAQTRKAKVFRPKVIRLNCPPEFKYFSSPEGWGYSCIWIISSFGEYSIGLFPFDSGSIIMEYWFTDDEVNKYNLWESIDLKGGNIVMTTRIFVDNKGDVHFNPYRVLYHKPDSSESIMNWGLMKFEYPIIRGINEIDNSVQPNKIHDRNYLLLPWMEGRELCDPWNRLQTDSIPGNATEDPHQLRIEMDYPLGYGATMQCTALYAKGVNEGIYFATHDDSLKAKQFIWEAYQEQNNDETKRQFTFSTIHYNDDICAGYRESESELSGDSSKAIMNIISRAFKYEMMDSLGLKLAVVEPASAQDGGISQNSIYPDIGGISSDKDCVPLWRDYKNDYGNLLVSRLNSKYTGIDINWYDAADKYKEWARGANGPIWAKTHRMTRDNESRSFYKDTGLAVWLLGSEFHLSSQISPSCNNFIKAFHNVIAPDDLKIGSFDWPKILIILGWDWHYPFDPPRYDDGRQYGNNEKYWGAHYGPPSTSSAPCNITENLAQIKNQGDFAIPYIFATRVFKPISDYDWPGYDIIQDGDFGSPWKNQINIPQNEKLINPIYGPRLLCCATSAFKSFLINRDEIIRSGYLDPNCTYKDHYYPDGVYHDIGFSFKGTGCLLCDSTGIIPGGKDIKSGPGIRHRYGLHLHYTSDHGGDFQVGLGGFINRAKRDILLENLYGAGGYASLSRRKGLFGTESVVEIFVDGTDCSGCAETWGPYKPVSIQDNGNLLTVIWYKWIREHTCSEIPLMQYVYNPVMFVKLSGHVNFSGGVGPGNANNDERHNVGSSFFWLAATSYLSGFILRVDYDIVPIDILSTMSKKADTYMLGWKRGTSDPENVPQEPINSDGSPSPGRHPYGNNKIFDAIHRTYSDLTKEKYIRMMAALRCRILPDYLVYGEMIRPGIISGNENKQYEFDYDYFFCFSPEYENKTTDFNPPYYWKVPRLITSAWQSYPYLLGRPAPIVFIIANASPEAISNEVNLKVIFDNFDSYSAQYQYIRLNPDQPNEWNNWLDPKTGEKIIEPIDGVIKHTFRIPAKRIQPYEIVVFKMIPITKA